ncbi:class I adenylate cyclase [Orbaceae bacterium ac157xtp]
MQNYISKVKKQLDELALIKHARAIDGMSASFQKVFLLLPSLFHFNDPTLPGFVNDSTPYGIAYFSPDSAILLKLKDEFGFSAPQAEQAPCKISALYSMGSTCSLGQSTTSDLDIWVCIENAMLEEQRLVLQQKCHLIEQWAKSFNIQLTLFIVDANRFKDKHHECLMGENCGSAQHMLLLEEFYRSATRLAGKMLLWFVIPTDLTINSKTYNSYDECIFAMIESNAIKRDEWIDFGSLFGLSAEEYFGASLWQLYKSIDSPFKAVLKTLLLEAYSWEYSENKTPGVAFEIKSLLLKGELSYYHLDAYYLILHKVTEYLLAINDAERLHLIRCCFYLKVNEKLTQPCEHSTWRREVISQLVKKWGWDEQTLLYFDNKQNWKIEQARKVHDILLQAMMTGYRNLLNFGRRNNLDTVISPQDLAILTRKLYAVYEVLPGKVTVINQNLAFNLAESYLTFIHVKTDRVNRAGWYVYTQKPSLDSIIGHQYIEYSDSIIKLVAWCYFNGLIAENTQIFFRDGANHDATKIKHLVNDLKSYFPLTQASASEAELYGPCEIRNLAIILNFKDEITDELDSMNLEDDTHYYDVLNFGTNEISLIQSINLLYRNSWNEIRVIHFAGSLCVLDAIKTLLNRMHKDADLPKQLKIFCYSKYFQKQIKTQMQSLIDRCIELRLSTSKNDTRQFMPLRINGSAWSIFFERLGVSIHQFDNAIDFYGAISNNKLHGQALNIFDERNNLPVEIDSVAIQGVVQFFFEDTQNGFDLYILNENNQVEIYRNCNGNKESMVRDVNSYYALSDDRFTFVTSSSVNFNLPQFYNIYFNEDGKRVIAPYN